MSFILILLKTVFGGKVHRFPPLLRLVMELGLLTSTMMYIFLHSMHAYRIWSIKNIETSICLKIFQNEKFYIVCVDYNKDKK